MQLVFFYGLFMDCDLLKSQGFTPSNAELVRLEGFGLRIGERATLVKSEHETAFGLVMEMPADQLNALYGAESVADYVPEAVVVLNEDDDEINCVVYNLSAEKLMGCNESYAQSLKIVAQKTGLPADYILEFEKWVRINPEYC